jgi:uracil-DNA glycosylase family 4
MTKESLNGLARGIQHCQECERSQTRNHAVPGEGDPASGMILLGEAPGKKEDQTGRPFVGRAGNYLDRILSQNDLERDRVFITSILKCYHPRPPRKNQIEKCLPWSLRQIEALNPKLILVMGRWAAWALAGMKNLGDVPKVLNKEGSVWIVTCHPAAAMRFPERDEEFRKGVKIFTSKAAESDL